MKSDFLLIVLVLGTIICATYADPTSSERKTQDDDTNSNTDFLKLIDQIVNLQSSNVDYSQNGRVDFISDAMKGARNFLVRGIAQLVRRFSNQALQQATHFLKNNEKGIANGAGVFNEEALMEAEPFLQNNGRGIAQAMGRLTGLAMSAVNGEALRDHHKKPSLDIFTQALIQKLQQHSGTRWKSMIKHFMRMAMNLAKGVWVKIKKFVKKFLMPRPSRKPSKKLEGKSGMPGSNKKPPKKLEGKSGTPSPSSKSRRRILPKRGWRSIWSVEDGSQRVTYILK